MKFRLLLLISMIFLLLISCKENRHKYEIEERKEYSDTIETEETVREISQTIEPPELTDNWNAGEIISPREVREVGIENCFEILNINDEIFRRINGHSYKENAGINLEDLRYLKLIHHDLSGNIKKGELICNKKIATDLYEIFLNLYNADYPISSIRLIDEFDADDIKSMQANNTSCFNYRTTVGGSKISKHGKGLAIDLNPLFNPYIKLNSGKVLPPEGEFYTNREEDFPYKIDRNDLAYKEFTKRGFKWGGDWRTVKDYQHFEK